MSDIIYVTKETLEKMKIELNKAKKIVTQQEKSKEVSTLTVVRMVDLPKKKVVRAFVEEIDGPIVLWEGAAYDAIGQWTDANVQARLTELYS
jgi:hypothetical protein